MNLIRQPLQAATFPSQGKAYKDGESSQGKASSFTQKQKPSPVRGGCPKGAGEVLIAE